MLLTKLLRIFSSKWAFIFVPLARCSLIRLFSLLALPASLLPRYLVQLFRRLKGPRYADMLFVTRESRHGCLRQADATRRFPPQSRKLRTSPTPLTVPWFFDSDFPPFPSTSGVSFTCLPACSPVERAGRQISTASRTLLSTAPRCERTGWGLAQ